MFREREKGVFLRASKKREPQKVVEVPPNFAPVARAFAKNKGVSREKGWGAGSVVLKVKGKIFAMGVRGVFVGKLPRSRVDELVNEGCGERYDPRRDGRVMREWIVVDLGQADWVKLAKEAYRYAKGGGA